jgi:GT2 family glycosyltransferase
MAFWNKRKRYRPGLDAVVVNYRTPDDLTGFVESFIAWKPVSETNLVMANVAPEKEDLAAAEQALNLDAPGLVLTHLPFEENVGYARACNAGLKTGDREIVALFNADTRVTEGTLKQCADALLANPEWGALGPRQVDQLGRFTASGIFGTNEAPKHRAWHDQDVGQCSDIRDDAVTVAGSAYFMRREVWEQLTSCRTYRSIAPGAEGAFLPTKLFYEETFCSYHARAHGYRNVYFGTAEMIHFWHGSIDANGAPASDLFDESRTYFRHACKTHGIACD